MFGFEKTYLLQKPVALKKSIECNTSFMSCFAVDPNVLAQSKKVHQKMKFTHEEDEQLRRLVKVFGDNSWSEVASCMPGRNKRQCKERWTNYLSPTVNNAPWTVAEDSLLLQKHAELGAKWVKISRFFPGRSDTSIKNRWMVLERRAKSEITKPASVSLCPLPVVQPVIAQSSFESNWFGQESAADLWDDIGSTSGMFDVIW